MKTHMQAPLGQRGFTLVELMVSTVVALFATLAIFQSFAVSETYRRTATSGGDASFSGAIGTAMLDRDLRMAGYGINTTSYLGCAVTGSESGAPINFTLAPVLITPGAGNLPDSVTIIASNTGIMPGAISFTSGMTSPTDNYVVSDAYGVQQNDLLILAQTGQPCTLVEATNTPVNGATQQNTIKHAAARYNPAGGIGPAYSSGAVVMDMGPIPIANTYRIQNNGLVVDQLIANQVGVLVAANVVQLKAFYGKSSTGSGIVDTWDQLAPTNWANVLAIRIALVARSAQPEKPPSPSAACNTTTASPVVNWDDNIQAQTTLDVTGTAPSGPSWKCYRYRVFHVTSSLRNLIWTPS
jgi:type IV pilus assembly protein PilW